MSDVRRNSDDDNSRMMRHRGNDSLVRQMSEGRIRQFSHFTLSPDQRITHTHVTMLDPVTLLSFTLLVNLIILAIVWQVYGPRIHALIAKKGEKDQVLGE